MSLHVECGPMKSNKSSNLINKLTTYADVNKCKVLIINHMLDTRNLNKGISCHSSLYQGLSNKLNCLTTNKLASVNVDDYHMIGVDEVQFFDDEEDLVSTIKCWLQHGKHIRCSGLDGTFEKKAFGYLHRLLPLSDTFTKLNAICDLCTQELLENNIQINPMNQVPAPFTKKISGSQNVIEIGDDKYLSVCRKHH